MSMKLNTLHYDWLTNQKITPEVLENFNVRTNDDGSIAFLFMMNEGILFLTSTVEALKKKGVLNTHMIAVVVSHYTGGT